MEFEVEVDTEVEVWAEVEADFPFAHHTDGRNDPLAYVIYTTCMQVMLLGRQCLYVIRCSSIILSHNSLPARLSSLDTSSQLVLSDFWQ